MIGTFGAWCGKLHCALHVGSDPQVTPPRPPLPSDALAWSSALSVPSAVRFSGGGERGKPRMGSRQQELSCACL